MAFKTKVAPGDREQCGDGQTEQAEELAAEVRGDGQRDDHERHSEYAADDRFQLASKAARVRMV